MANVKLYYMEHKELLPLLPALEDHAGGFIPHYMERCRSSKQTKAILGFLSSACLLKEVLGITRDEQLIFSPVGKPSLVDQSVCFSLSHDEEYTILAVSASPIGCDIEKITAPKMKVAERSFPSIYYNELLPNPSPEKFTELWTLTEAILKAEGTGFTASLKEHPEWLSKWKLKSFSFYNYWISVAASAELTADPELIKVHPLC